MSIIHHVVSGDGSPPFVLVHGFTCDHTDWAAQVAHLSPRHKTVAVDLKGHGATPGTPADCTIEGYGADVVAVMEALDLPPAIVVGHSMGCRVAVEVAVQAPGRTAGVILVDGSQFNRETEALVRPLFAVGGYGQMVRALFAPMFTDRTAPEVRTSIEARALALPREIGEKITLDTIRYDIAALEGALRQVTAPLLVLQSTYTTPDRNRHTLKVGQQIPYFELFRRSAPSARIEIVPDTGHFTQIDAPDATNAVLDAFVSSLA